MIYGLLHTKETVRSLVQICFYKINVNCRELSEKVRDRLHSYIDERGINESLFPFLQAWLYVKDHRNLIRWFKSVGTLISEEKTLKASSGS